MLRPLFVILLGLVFFGCSNSSETQPASPVPEVTPAPPPETRVYSFQVFVITDSAGVSHGSGYDIYDGTKRIIHQVNIPGEPGNDGFVNKEEAEKVAQLVVNKLQGGGGFPTVTRAELDSLHITLKNH